MSRSRKESWDKRKLFQLLTTAHLPGFVYINPARVVAPHLQHLVNVDVPGGTPCHSPILPCLRAVRVYLNTPAWKESAAFGVIQPRVDALIASDTRRHVLRQPALETVSLENTPEAANAIVDVCLGIFDCCWGRRAERTYRAVWFCYAKYRVELFGVEDCKRDTGGILDQYHTVLRKTLWETLPTVMDVILGVIDVLRRSNEIQMMPEESLVVNHVFDVLMSPEHTVNGHLNVMEYMDRTRIRSDKPDVTWRLRVFNELQKSLRARLKSMNWNHVLDYDG